MGSRKIVCGGEAAELSLDVLHVVARDAHRAPAWANSRGKYRVQLVPPRVAQDQMIAAIGAKQIHTIVVARAPEKRAERFSSRWESARSVRMCSTPTPSAT